MNITRQIALGLALTGLLAGCGGGDKTDGKEEAEAAATMEDTAAPADAIAMVNGKPVLERHFNAYVKQRKAAAPEGSELTDERMLDELINLELAIQDAERKKLDQQPKVRQAIENQRRTILLNAAFEDYVKNNPLSEEQMRKDYEARMSELTLTEYLLRHILLENADDAATVVTQLDKGGKFLDLVKKYSKGPSAAEGGLLGWQSEFDIIPEFRDQVDKLEKGQYAKTPIKTQFGWHIVYLEDKRVNPPPPYEQVKDRVKNVLQRRQVEDYFLKLRMSADVKVLEAEAPAQPPQRGINLESYGDPNPQ